MISTCLRKAIAPHILTRLTHLCAMGKLEEAIDVVETYCDNRGDTTLSKSMLLHLLQTSSKKKDIRSGRRIHFLVIKTRLDSSSLQLMDHLIRMFTLCGSLRDANEAFGQVLNPSIYTGRLSSLPMFPWVRAPLHLSYFALCKNRDIWQMVMFSHAF